MGKTLAKVGSKVGSLAKRAWAVPEVRGLVFGLLLLTYGNTAHAQATAAFENLRQAICNIYNALKGTLGLALLILVFGIGAVSLMIGGRRAMPLMISAAIGGVILAAAPSFAKIFIGNGSTGCTTTTSS